MSDATESKVWILAGLPAPLAEILEKQLTQDGHQVVRATPNSDGASNPTYDPGQAASWDNLFEAVGSADVVVLGITAATESALEDMDLNAFRKDNEANLIGSFLGVQAAIKAFDGRGGKIVTLGSASARKGVTASPTLAAGSGGLAMLTRASAVEVAGHRPHIHVNGVLSDNNALWPTGADSDSEVGLDEIAEAVMFLGGPGADYMTGSLVPVGAPGP